jgi:hypothetical protein
MADQVPPIPAVDPNAPPDGSPEFQKALDDAIMQGAVGFISAVLGPQLLTEAGKFKEYADPNSDD